MPKIDLNAVLTQADQLPAVSQTAIELVNLLADDNIDIHTLADKVRLDPVVASRVLKVANSSFFSRGRQVGSISDAVMVIGLNNARSLIIAAAVMTKSQSPRVPGFSIDYFWRHSLSTAVICQQLALHLGLSTGIAFSAGLLHDVGKLILALAWPEEYAEVIRLCQEESLLSFKAEQEVFGLDHSAIGAGVLSDWNLPTPLVNAIQYHHIDYPTNDLLVGALHLANQTASYAMNPDATNLPEHVNYNEMPVNAEGVKEMMPEMQKQYQRYSLLF